MRSIHNQWGQVPTQKWRKQKYMFQTFKKKTDWSWWQKQGLPIQKEMCARTQEIGLICYVRLLQSQLATGKCWLKTWIRAKHDHTIQGSRTIFFTWKNYRGHRFYKVVCSLHSNQFDFDYWKIFVEKLLIMPPQKTTVGIELHKMEWQKHWWKKINWMFGTTQMIRNKTTGGTRQKKI